MRKLLVTIGVLLGVASGTAWAGWTKVWEEDKFETFVDLESTTKIGKARRVWEVRNYKNSEEHGRASSRVLMEYYCDKREAKFIEMSFHSERFGKGETLSYMGPTDNLVHVAPDSDRDAVFKLVCPRK